MIFKNFSFFNKMGNKPITDKNIDEIVKVFNYYGFVSNDYFNLDIVIKYPNKPWDWKKISQNGNLTCSLTKESLRELIDKPLDWNYLSGKLQEYSKTYKQYIFVLSMDLMMEFPDKPWNYFKLTQQFCLSENLGNFKYMRKFPNKPWDWKFLTHYVSYGYVSEFPNKPWNWERMSNYPSLPYDFAVKHLEKLPLTDNLLKVLKTHEEKMELLKKYQKIKTSEVVPWGPKETGEVIPSAPLRETEEIEGM